MRVKSYIHVIFVKNTFNRKSNVNVHIKAVHEGKKPYQCNSCDQAFPNKSRLDRHSRVHTNIRPYDCSACDAKFKRRHHLATHLKTIHGSVM